MKAVLDTNVLVSAVLNPSGTPFATVTAWRDGRFDLVTTPPLLAELADVVTRPRIARRVSGPVAAVEAFMRELQQRPLIVTPTFTLDVVADDPDDNRVLEAAVAGEADYIVSGDRHLLDLGEYAGIPIVRPAQFLALLAAG